MKGHHTIEPATTIDMTPERLERLRAAYELAMKEKKPEFKFEGHHFFTGYAKYFIEYVGKRLAGR